MKFISTAATVAALLITRQVAAGPITVGTPQLIPRQDEGEYICDFPTAGKILEPAAGTTFYWVYSTFYTPITFELLYCSASTSLLKTQGLGVGLITNVAGNPPSADTNVLVKNQPPTLDEPGLASPYYTGYRFNVTINTAQWPPYNSTQFLSVWEYACYDLSPDVCQGHARSTPITFVVIPPPCTAKCGS